MNTRTIYQIEKEMSAIINQIRESSSAKEMKEYRTALNDLALEYAAVTYTGRREHLNRLGWI